MLLNTVQCTQLQRMTQPHMSAVPKLKDPGLGQVVLIPHGGRKLPL